MGMVSVFLALVLTVHAQLKPAIPPTLSTSPLEAGDLDPGTAYADMGKGNYRVDVFALSAPPIRLPVNIVSLRNSEQQLDCGWWEPLDTKFRPTGRAEDCLCVPINPDEPPPIPDLAAWQNATYRHTGACIPTQSRQCHVYTVWLGNGKNNEWLLFQDVNTNQTVMFFDFLAPIMVGSVVPTVNQTKFNIPNQCVRRDNKISVFKRQPPVIAQAEPSQAVSAGLCMPTKIAGLSRYYCDNVAYTLMVADSCMQGGCGLVVDIHGFTMSADQQDANTNMRAKGSANGYVVLQPAARGQPPATSWRFEEDPPNVLAVVQELMITYAINPKKVHVQGLSEGCHMTWLMFCLNQTIWATLGPMIADASSCFKTVEDARKLTPRPVIWMDGIHDALHSFKDTQKSVQLIQQAWNLSAPTVVANGSHFTHVRYQGAGSLVQEFIYHDHFAIPFGPLPVWGHCIFGSKDLPGTTRSFGQVFHFGCPYLQPAEYDAIDKMWQFILDHPLP